MRTDNIINGGRSLNRPSNTYAKAVELIAKVSNVKESEIKSLIKLGIVDANTFEAFEIYYIFNELRAKGCKVDEIVMAVSESYDIGRTSMYDRISLVKNLLN